jgi:peptide deformylase
MKLITAPNKFLEQQVKTFDYSEFDPLVISQQMISIMSTEKGLGLAANQVELDAQIFVMRPFLNKENTVLDTLVVINPVIQAISEETEKNVEGCLSYPGVFLHINRPRKILVEFDTLTSNGESVIHVGQTLEDIDARIFLHEYDHLAGIQFVDRVSALKKSMALKKIQKHNKRK